TAKEFVQDDDAVGVRPLQIVDPDHEQLPRGKLRQHRTQRLERAASEAEGIRLFGVASADGLRNRLHLEQHWKDTRQRRYIARQEIAHVLRWIRCQIAAQAVHDTVEPFVWNRLVLVAPAGEHHRLAIQVVEELTDQRTLA